MGPAPAPQRCPEQGAVTVPQCQPGRAASAGLRGHGPCPQPGLTPAASSTSARQWPQTGCWGSLPVISRGLVQRAVPSMPSQQAFCPRSLHPAAKGEHQFFELTAESPAHLLSSSLPRELLRQSRAGCTAVPQPRAAQPGNGPRSCPAGCFGRAGMQRPGQRVGAAGSRACQAGCVACGDACLGSQSIFQTL